MNLLAVDQQGSSIDGGKIGILRITSSRQNGVVNPRTCRKPGHRRRHDSARDVDDDLLDLRLIR